MHIPLIILLLFAPVVFSAIGMPCITPRLSDTFTKTEYTAAGAETIIDYLSGDAQYSYFLRHIQRLGLVPVIMQMRNVTVFAPINSAFVNSELAINDTATSVLRYFANQRFRIVYLNGSSTVLDSIFTTKSSKLGNHSFPLKIAAETPGNASETGPYIVNEVAEIVEWDGYAKHQRSFIQTIDHLLPSAVSMCDLFMKKGEEFDEINGHSISFVKQVFQSVFGLRKPLLDESPVTCDQFLDNVSTVLVPTDQYIDASLSELEKRYFLTIHHGILNPNLFPTKHAVREMRHDALHFLSNLLLPDLVGGLNGTNTSHASVWNRNSYVTSYDKSTDRIRFNDQVWSVAGSTSLPLFDGILHLLDSDPKDTTQSLDFFSACKIQRVEMIPRKALYAMHFSELALELQFYKKSKLIDDNAWNQTILIDASDRDDFFDEDNLLLQYEDPNSNDMNEIPDDQLVNAYSFSGRQQTMYKFIDGFLDMGAILTSETSRFHALLDSKLCSRKRINSCYRVKVLGTLENGNSSIYFNDKYKATRPIIAANNNSIYVLGTDFALPASFEDVLASLISDGTTRDRLDHVTVDKMSCLQTLKYLDAFGLLSTQANYHGYTVFLPCGRAIWDGLDNRRNKNYYLWNSLGLILQYLENHPKLFEKMLRGMFVEDLIYSDFGLGDGVESYRIAKTLNGDSVNISETYHQGDYNHIISVNNTLVPIPLNSDVLFNQGVIHITQNILFPSDFQVSLKDLIHAAHESSGVPGYFTDLIEKFPKLSKKLSLDDPFGDGYSLLVPTSDSLRKFNITSNHDRLLEFLELHLITNAEAQILLSCMGIPYFDSGNSSHVIKTNQTHGPFMCYTERRTGKTTLAFNRKLNVLFNLENEESHQVRILNYGCSQTKNTNGSCVFLLETPLKLEWFDPKDNFLHVHIGWISLGIGIVIGVILFGFCTTTVALCLSRENSKAKALSGLESGFATAESSYMPITSDEDFLPVNYDLGYETDVDMMRSEADSLLTKKGNSQKNYRSLSTLGVPSAPRNIKKQGLIEAIGRGRNLPPVNI